MLELGFRVGVVIFKSVGVSRRETALERPCGGFPEGNRGAPGVVSARETGAPVEAGTSEACPYPTRVSRGFPLVPIP